MKELTWNQGVRLRRELEKRDVHFKLRAQNLVNNRDGTVDYDLIFRMSEKGAEIWDQIIGGIE
jgi:hypothetical protein